MVEGAMTSSAQSRRVRLRVLMVEADEGDQQAFRRMVREERLPYDVEVAATVAAAHEQIRARRFDVVVADYALADGTALDVFEAAGEAAGIIVTGAPDQQLAVRGFKAGAFDYLVKDAAQNHLRVLPRAIEDALRHKEQEQKVRMLSHTLRSISDAVYLTTSEDRIVFVNRAFCQTYGYTEAEVLGRTSDLLWKSRPAYDLPATPGALLDWNSDALQLTKWGAEVPMSLSRSAVRDENGGVLAVVRVARDMSEWNKAADRLQTVNAELEKSRAALQELSVRDELTGLFNRRELERLLRDELARTIRHARPASLLFFDLDRLARVNEEHGEPAGDEVLRQVARLLRQGIRTLDRPARWDGEQFALLLPETGEEGARVVAERLRERIAAERITVVRGDGSVVNLAVTACAGIASAPRDAGSGEELVAAAERALYRAKALGRNRTAACPRAA
jgi:diguanylate cyclase (GGDEF)-like protein/PAS domain S-box-containing protein